MNPLEHPAEAVPLQPAYPAQSGYLSQPGYPAQSGYPGQHGYPGQPGGPAMVQHTTVTISTDPPKDHIIWSLVNFFYANLFCLGLVAFIFSIKARDRKVAGDLNGAREYGTTARNLNIAATVLGSLTVFITMVTFISVASQANRYNSGYSYRG